MSNRIKIWLTAILLGSSASGLLAERQEATVENKIIESRLKAVRCLLSEQNIDCFIVLQPANVTYVTGFSGSDSWAVITVTEVYLLTDSRYIEQAQSQCYGCKIIERTDSLAKATVELLQKLKPQGTVAVEDSVRVPVFEMLKKGVGSSLKLTEDIVESIRSRKDGGEIASIKAAAQIATRALKQTLEYIRPGMTENELAGALDFQIRKLGAKSGSETTVAFGANASRPHHQPGERQLAKNDCILIDFTVRYNHYCCDLTRCFTVGEPNEFYKKVYRAVQEAQAAAIKMIKDGVEVGGVDAAAKSVIASHNLPVYKHKTGHGLGLQVHELPTILADDKSKLQAGMVLTIEPAVYIPGELGVRIEDDILVTKDGCEVLSRGNNGDIGGVIKLRSVGKRE